MSKAKPLEFTDAEVSHLLYLLTETEDAKGYAYPNSYWAMHYRVKEKLTDYLRSQYEESI